LGQWAQPRKTNFCIGSTLKITVQGSEASTSTSRTQTCALSHLINYKGFLTFRRDIYINFCLYGGKVVESFQLPLEVPWKRSRRCNSTRFQSRKNHWSIRVHGKEFRAPQPGLDVPSIWKHFYFCPSGEPFISIMHILNVWMTRRVNLYPSYGGFQWKFAIPSLPSPKSNASVPIKSACMR
jgi:hypothetical protein